MTSSKASRLLAFIRRCDLEKGPEGPILYVCDGPFRKEIELQGWDLSDHAFPKEKVQQQPFQGLYIFEGWVEYTSEPDPDIAFVGAWRPLTHWEMCRVRDGVTPWQLPTMEDELERLR